MRKIVVGFMEVVSALAVVAAESVLPAGNVCADPDRNLLRNGSFEFANQYNGMKTLLDAGDHLAFMWSGQGEKWCDLELEQWWGEGPTIISAASRSRSP